MKCKNVLFKDIVDGINEYEADKPMKLAFFIGHQITEIKVCPMCKVGVNSAKAGGNEHCFHCDLCGFVECAHSDQEIEYLKGN